MFWLLDRIFDNERLREFYRTFFAPHVYSVLKLTHIVVVMAALLFTVVGLSYIGVGESRVGVAMALASKVAYIAFLIDRISLLVLSPQTLWAKYKIPGHLLNAVLFLSLVLPLQPLRVYLLSLLALMDLSNWFIGMLGRKINASLVLSLSFLLLITLGTLLLMSPKSLSEGANLSFIDAFFVATSSVCVTGLSPVDVSSTFSSHGQLVLLMLIQVGGLGIMTITSFFALLMSGNSTVYNQMIVKDLVSGNSLTSLLSTLLHIIAFTFAIELFGACLIWTSIRGNVVDEPVFFSIFHSISAFCNAGFSTLPDGLSNPAFLAGDTISFYLVISLLIFLGSIGYPLLTNIKELLVHSIKWMAYRGRRSSLYRKVHIVDVNTKLVFSTTMSLIIVGTLLLAIFEWNGAFANLTTTGKLTHALFNAVSPRTAGFSSVPLAGFGIQALLLYSFLMWIGGAAQSTAGGIKVNVFALVLKSFKANLVGMQDVVIYKRKVSTKSINRAHATVIASLGFIFIAFGLLTLLEPTLSKGGLLFEVVSAISTVGSSLNITSELSDPSKILVIVLMFCGRVGFFTLLTSFIQQKKGPFLKHPEEEVLVG